MVNSYNEYNKHKKKEKKRKEQNKKMNVFDHGMLTNLNANVRFFLYFQTFTLKPGHIHFQAL